MPPSVGRPRRRVDGGDPPSRPGTATSAASVNSVSRTSSPYIPLFWRLFVPNAAVLLGAWVVLTIQPANGRILVLAAGLVVLLTVNLILMRRAFAPLARLTALMDEIDPLQPGRRLPPLGPASEVTRLTDAFNRMLDRLETERRESAMRALAAEAAERRPGIDASGAGGRTRA